MGDCDYVTEIKRKTIYNYIDDIKTAHYGGSSGPEYRIQDIYIRLFNSKIPKHITGCSKITTVNP